MSRWLRAFVVMIVALGISQVALAQTSPSQLEFALQALSNQVGQPITVEDLDGWQWSQTNYPDSSLGCPQPGEVYTQVVTSGYQFLLVYQGQTYDYRVSEDGNTVILCTATDIGTPVEPPTFTPDAAEPTTAPSTPLPTVPGTEPGCPEGLDLRLTAGQQARVTVGLPSNVRSGADVSAEQLGQLQPGDVFTVLSDAVCGPDGLYWYEIQAGELAGWIAQGELGLYYVEPIPQALPDPSTLGLLVAENVGQIVELSRIDSNLQGAIAWSPDGMTLAVGNSNTTLGGVWLYDVAQLQNPPVRLETGTVVTSVAFTPDGAFLILGDADGTVSFWQPNAEEATYSFPAHEVAIEALSVSSDGLILATVGANNTVRLWGVPQQITQG
ncbi:MAG: SH3 domain-containing protein [Chloroflexi bacterium]|nr:SH3 domain-containing protein [Chloroflexota bacterium]